MKQENSNSLSDENETINSIIVEKTPVFYGWVILAAATIGIIMTTPGQTLGVSVFLDHIISEMGLSRSLVSLFYTGGTLIGSFILPYVGNKVDTKGPRAAVFVISLLFALACVWMGLVVNSIMLLVGFIMIRGLGQGSLSLVSNYVVNIWFVRLRGLAVGISGLGFAIATAFFPYLIETLIHGFGWRMAYILLGILVALIMIPVGLLFYRAHPENYGLYPDGKKRENIQTDVDNTIIFEPGYTPRQAKKTFTFWLFVSGDLLSAAFSTGLVFHHYSIMSTSGIDRLAATAFFAPMGISIACANLVSGFLMDRVPPRFLLSIMVFLQALALIMAVNVTGYQTILLYGTIIGFTQGMKNGVTGSVYAYYFGRAYIGAIRGFASTLSIAGSALGPFLFAFGFDFFGSYHTTLYIAALFPLAVALIAMFIKPFRADGTVV